MYVNSDGQHDGAYLLQLSMACPKIEEIGVSLPHIRRLNQAHDGFFSWSCVMKRSEVEKQLASSLVSAITSLKQHILIQ